MRLLIDISNLLYRSAYKLHLSDREGNSTGAVFGAMKALGHLADVWRPEEMVICWDGADAVKRRAAVYPDYKANRKKDPAFIADLNRQKGVLREMLGHLPVVQVGADGVEADDVIAVLVAFLRMEKVGIVTSDRDLYCLASERCRIIQPGGKEEKLELEPHQYLAYKALVGDTSDNIKGVARLGDKRVTNLLREYGTLEGIVAGIAQTGMAADINYSPEEWKTARVVVERNLKLMTPGLMLEQAERVMLLDQYRCRRLKRTTDVKGLRASLMGSGFTSIVQRLSGWLMPFRGMERHAEAQAEAEGQVRAESRSGSPEGTRARRSEHRWIRIVRAVEPDARIHRAVVQGPSSARSRVLQVAATRLGGVHAEAPVGLVAASLRCGAARVVRAARVQRLALGARGRRAGDPFAPVLHDAEVLRGQRARAGQALSLLPLFRGGDRWRWLKSRPSRELMRIAELAERAVAAQQVAAKDVDFILGLEEAYAGDMPAWMKTEQELKADAERTIKNVRSEATRGRGAGEGHRQPSRESGR